jgi:hypothetical protein
MKDRCVKNFQSFQSIFTNINYNLPKHQYNLYL